MPNKILCYDIEAGNLSANRGRLYAIAWKWVDSVPLTTGQPCKTCGGRHSKTSVASLLDYNEIGSNGLMRLDDRELVHEAYRLLSLSDVALTFNGTLYDRTFLNAKFMKEGLKPLPATRMLDLYQSARHIVRISPKSLASISHYLGLKHQKTKLDWDVWDRAGEGDAKSLTYIVKHGAADVLVTEELYLKHMRPWVANHPFIFEDRDNCPRCDGQMIRSKKLSTNAGKIKIQYRCKRCGGYQTRAA